MRTHVDQRHILSSANNVGHGKAFEGADPLSLDLRGSWRGKPHNILLDPCSGGGIATEVQHQDKGSYPLKEIVFEKTSSQSLVDAIA